MFSVKTRSCSGFYRAAGKPPERSFGGRRIEKLVLEKFCAVNFFLCKRSFYCLRENMGEHAWTSKKSTKTRMDGWFHVSIDTVDELPLPLQLADVSCDGCGGYVFLLS